MEGRTFRSGRCRTLCATFEFTIVNGTFDATLRNSPHGPEKSLLFQPS